MDWKRHLFEFEDLSWFPDTIRQSMTDCLRFILKTVNLYEPVTPLLLDGMSRTGDDRILDLCSGGGGAIQQVQQNLEKASGRRVKVMLSDKFPNLNAYEMLRRKTDGGIDFLGESVDAAQAPKAGFRTIFTAFHHFDRPFAASVLKNAVDSGSGIGVFDGGDKNAAVVLGVILVHPFVFLFCTPFFRPFRWSRLLFTYLIPVIPVCQIWDGVVSILRLYTPADMLALAREADPAGRYEWKAGKVRNRFGMRVAYLTGIPKMVTP